MKKCSSKLLSGLLAVFFVFIFIAPVNASVKKDGVHITIFHTNDLHARVKDGDDFGSSLGMAWISGAVWAARDTDDDILFLDAGDTFHGMPIINVTQGQNMTMLLNLAGYDALTAGNHDFNFGSDRLMELGSALNFPILSANITTADYKNYLFLPYKCFTLDGVKIAVIGLTTPDTAKTTNPLNVAAVKFTDPIAAARELVPELRKKNDVIIVLSHLGLDKSSSVTSAELAEKVLGIDVIIDGHSHTALSKGMKVGNTLIAQTGWHGYNLGKVELVVNNHELKKAAATLLDRKAVEKLAKAPDSATLEMLNMIDEANKADFSKVVAKSDNALAADRDKLRRTETELGDVVADAMREGANSDIAVINGGAIRAGIPAGEITKGHIMECFPFGNNLVKLTVSGKIIKEMLEQSNSKLPAEYGGYLQVSGLEFDINTAAKPYKRISNIKVNGKDLEENKNYTLATNDFIARGGDGYDMLKDVQKIGEYGTLEEIFATYLSTAEENKMKTEKTQ